MKRDIGGGMREMVSGVTRTAHPLTTNAVEVSVTALNQANL